MKRSIASVGRWSAWALGVSGVWLSGCATTSALTDPGALSTDRFVRVYPELRGGRFLIIADFEDEKHLDLFRMEGATEGAICTQDRKAGRAETGKNALVCTVGSPGDEIVIGNTEGARWYLKRDWRAYDLLLISVHAPRDGLSLEATVSSGTENHRASAQTSLRLDKGWNVLRLDLAEVGGLVALDDMQELRWAVSGVDRVTRVVFDDIVLTSNREDVSGDSRNAVGGLYAQRAGRRWNVGAGGKFELTFSHGQITAWYNLATDPNRVRNLVQGTTLGPTPVVISADGSELGGFSSLGRSVAATQRLLEANPVRVVIASEWHFVDDLDQPTQGRPFQRWVYTIYPSGQVFVTVEATARTETWVPPGLGLMVSMASTAGGDWSVTAEEGVMARNAALEALLVFAVGGEATKIMSRHDPEGKQLSLVARGATDATVARWNAMIGVQGADERRAAATLLSYVHPQSIRLEQGRPANENNGSVRDTRPDLGSGCYAIEAEQSRVRFTLEGQRTPITSPCFDVSQVGEGTCWVYVDHLIHEATARSHEDHLIFQIAGTADRRVVVEVICNR